MGAIIHVGDSIGATPPIDDSSVSDKKLWSSQKTKAYVDVLKNIAYLSLDGQAKAFLQARIVAPTINFTNGQGSVVVNTEGKSISSIAFAVHSGLTTTLGVTGVSVDNQTNTISISLSNTTYNGSTEFNLLYFIAV